ncbi:BAX inhibitor (BI)-1/YccA family protein [Solimonas sp. K1W22B-7]|uniref:Bax inhibitor-1/YccA family protein n=1 Tax=Solimonas sp. K1W22B-7 TaxID=2303331 RepID=UPI000E32FDC6|nr:Bax inhibitor-1/YccA family protein [Solimonas sp. K1W22B-7]AXQ28856.1 BAX inhibitor (BI)-1/YccA family protein [Solimonas sp. K1W22B-7]
MSWNNQLRPAPINSGAQPRPLPLGQDAAASAASKVLRNTYLLLSMTLLFSAVMAGASMALGVGYGISLLCSAVSLGLLWFVVPRTANSPAGLWVVFAVTGLLGFGLGPVINRYLGTANGGQTVMMALGMTGAIFVALSAYAVKTRRDFSFMRGFLFTGIMVVFMASIALLVASAFGLYLQPLHLGISALFALFASGIILYQTGEIVNGGETNYVLATVTLYVSIYNLFTSLLHLLGFANDD